MHISQNNKKYCLKSFNVSRQYYFIYYKYEKCLKTLGISNDTIEWRLKHIRYFLSFLSSKKITIAKLKPDNIYDFNNILISKYSNKTIENRNVCIRLFLNWLFKEKMIDFSGTQIIPKIICYKESKIISDYSNEEITTLLNSININSRYAKRDLVLMLLFVRYGIRPSDICSLKLNNFDFIKNKITYTQNKTNELIILPLLNEVRYAFIDYLKKEYNNYNFNNNLFFNNNGEKIDSKFCYNLIGNYFKISGINFNGRKHGPYSLRHSLGSSLINNKTNIYIIASILGHINLETTKIYAKVNLHDLKNMSLEVPQWKN